MGVTVDVDGTMIIAAIIALAGTGAATALVTQWFERRNRRAEADKTGAEADLADAQATDVLVQAGKTAVEILTAELNRALLRIEKLEAAAAEKDTRIIHLEEGEREKDKRIGHLEDQVTSLEQHIAELHGEDA